MHRLIAAGCIVLLAAAVACGRSDLFEAASEPQQAVTVTRYSPPPEAELPSQAIAERRLIRIVDLELAVDDIEATAGQIRDLASSARSLIGVLQTLAGFAIFFVIVVLPVTVIVAIPIWGVARLWQGVQARRIGQSPAPTEEVET